MSEQSERERERELDNIHELASSEDAATGIRDTLRTLASCFWRNSYSPEISELTESTWEEHLPPSAHQREYLQTICQE